MDFFGIQMKDVILMVAGALIALPIAGGWQGLSRWIQQRGRKADELESVWRARLTSNDSEERRSAFQEIMMRALYQFFLGNMLFAASGIAWIGDILGIYPLQTVLAVVFSIGAAFFYLIAAGWLRRYFRYSEIEA